MLFRSLEEMRYGENPHQFANLYEISNRTIDGIAQGKILHGKAMSFNNYTDADAALRAITEAHAPRIEALKFIIISPPSKAARFSVQRLGEK